MVLYKYHGAGNDFLLADCRSPEQSSSGATISGRDVSADAVRRLCDRHTGFGSDGFMVLENDGDYDFRMRFWNPDGSSGMMCGNGGRCIAAFADRLGIAPKRPDSGDSVPALKSYHFMAPDGPHTAYVLSRDGTVCTVRLGMKDVTGVRRYGGGAYFLDTGTRHCVVFADADVDDIDIASEGPRYRQDPRFAPQGANADFVTVLRDGIKVRTFEKGVEDETLACGTGIVASAIAAYICRGAGTGAPGGRVSVKVQARIARLEVSFRPVGSSPGAMDGQEMAFRDVWLTGPAEFVGTVSPENFVYWKIV